MAFYECVLIARQDITSAQVETLVGQFSEILEQNGGTVASKEFWGLRTLAYKIKKNRKGHYVLLNLDAPGEAVHEMERNMRLNEDVLRYMSVRVDELDTSPSAMMQPRGKDDRGPRRGGGRGFDRGHDRGGDRGGDRGAGRESEGKPAAADKPTQSEPSSA